MQTPEQVPVIGGVAPPLRQPVAQTGRSERQAPRAATAHKCRNRPQARAGPPERRHCGPCAGHSRRRLPKGSSVSRTPRAVWESTSQPRGCNMSANSRSLPELPEARTRRLMAPARPAVPCRVARSPVAPMTAAGPTGLRKKALLQPFPGFRWNPPRPVMTRLRSVSAEESSR